MVFRRFRMRRTALIATLALTVAIVASLANLPLQSDRVSAQSVGWLSDSSVSYLTSSGITVLVPSWVPGPVSGSSPEISAGSGSYSIYFFGGTSFLYVTGESGASFPGGSEADPNVELFVNADVQGYPAIQDIGIPAGSSTPIYDKVMWIAGGVMYTIYGNGLDTDSLTLANSSVALSAPAPVVDEPPTESVQETSPETSTTSDTSSNSSETGSQSTTTQSESSDSTASSTTTTDTTSSASTSTVSSDGTDGAVFVTDAGDGTGGPLPPVYEDDGTGGAWVNPGDISIVYGVAVRHVFEDVLSAA